MDLHESFLIEREMFQKGEEDTGIKPQMPEARHNAGTTISNTLTTSTWTDNGTSSGGPPSTAVRRYNRIALLP